MDATERERERLQCLQYAVLPVGSAETQEKTSYSRQATMHCHKHFLLCSGHQACCASSIAKVGRLVMILYFPSHKTMTFQKNEKLHDLQYQNLVITKFVKSV